MIGIVTKHVQLTLQPLATDQGTQLPAERPGGNTGSRQPHVRAMDPANWEIYDGTNHWQRLAKRSCEPIAPSTREDVSQGRSVLTRRRPDMA